jgi:ketosteroid isomerase-like protein
VPARSRGAGSAQARQPQAQARKGKPGSEAQAPDDAVFEFRYIFPGLPQRLDSREALMALYVGYGDNIVLHGADELVVHRSQDPRVVIIEYEVHGKIVPTGSSYDNRFISVVTIEGRKIVRWRNYMDSLAAMTALSQAH